MKDLKFIPFPGFARPFSRLIRSAWRATSLPAVLLTIVLLATSSVKAQKFTVLADVDQPEGGLTLSGDTLYGTESNGGAWGTGSVFKINTDGTGFSILYSFTMTNSANSTIVNDDGCAPAAGLVLSGKTLYGTTEFGGSNGVGTVFAIDTDGTGFRNLHTFSAEIDSTNSDGDSPRSGLFLSGDTLYGTAPHGGALAFGTVFSINTNGAGFTPLHAFAIQDGIRPAAGVISFGDTLYGTTVVGGTVGPGVIFAVNKDGSNFRVLHGFNYNTDGGFLAGALILSGDTLYGTASDGGISGSGTVFKLNTDGTGFSTLHSFTNGVGTPEAELILSSNTLYGTTYNVDGDFGTVFAVNTDGTGYSILHYFDSSDGRNSSTGLVLSGNTLYGTALGGYGSSGTVFSLQLGIVSAPQLSITASGNDIVLMWPAATGFTLQSTTNLAPAVQWNPVLRPSAVVNGQNVVTNPISGTRQFYRLIH